MKSNEGLPLVFFDSALETDPYFRWVDLCWLSTFGEITLLGMYARLQPTIRCFLVVFVYWGNSVGAAGRTFAGEPKTLSFTGHAAATVFSDSTARREKHFYWINAGLGGPGIAGGLSLNFQYHQRIITLRTFYHASEDTGFFGTPAQSASDLSLLYGTTHRGRVFFASVAAALGMVSGTHRGRMINSGWFGPDYELDYYDTVGIPLETQLFWQCRHVGLGVTGFANLNLEHSYGGILFCIQLGKLRPATGGKLTGQ